VATSTDCGGAAIVPQGIHWCVGSYFRLVEWCLHGWQLAFNCRSFLLLHRCSSLRCRAHVSRWWNRGQQAVAPLAARQEASVWQIQDGSLAHNSEPRADGSARAARASASRCRSTRRIHTAFPRVALVHARPALNRSPGCGSGWGSVLRALVQRVDSADAASSAAPPTPRSLPGEEAQPT
jgi:hypothetical protein